jgi:hypothetical protein
LENKVRYTGEWIVDTNIRQGKGKSVYPDGSLYEGSFVDDKAHGKGRLIMSNGELYEGQLIKDMRHGYGRFTNENGTKYEGMW